MSWFGKIPCLNDLFIITVNEVHSSAYHIFVSLAKISTVPPEILDSGCLLI